MVPGYSREKTTTVFAAGTESCRSTKHTPSKTKPTTGKRYALEPDEDNEALKIASGDHIEVELQWVDPSAYVYFLTLAQYTGEGPPTAPANPISNISNGALGYFSAHTVSRRTIVVE